MSDSTEAGLLELEAGLTRVGVSFPAEAKIACAAPYSVGKRVINCLLVEALNLLGLGTVDIPRPIFGADVSEVPGGIISQTISLRLWQNIGHIVYEIAWLGGQELALLAAFTYSDE